MTDVGIFVFGCVVFTIAGIGGFLFLYTKFRQEYMRQNLAQLDVSPEAGPGPAAGAARSRRT